MSVFAQSAARTATSHAHRGLVPRWLIHLGALGLFAVSVVDASIIPLPIPGSTDLLLLWLVSHRGNPWLLTLSAIAGSLLGGYTTWSAGRRGGEVTLRRAVPARFLERIVGWAQRHPILAVFLPAVLPPPIPLSPFLLASGALGVSRNRFLVAFGAARTLRYSLITWLGVAYGRGVVRLWSSALQKWSAPLLWGFFSLLVAGLCFGIWKYRAQRRSEASEERAVKVAVTQTD